MLHEFKRYVIMSSRDLLKWQCKFA